jgi:hypothetical protein
MAAWQFSMHLVPRGQLTAVCLDLVSPVPGAVFDETSWWSSSQPPSDLAERLARVVGEVISWSPESRQWGLSEASTVDVRYEAGRVDEIHARLDLRAQCSRLIEVLAQLALDADAWWLGGNATIRIPVGQSREAIAAAAAASDAARFVADPGGFLDELAAKRGPRAW